MKKRITDWGVGTARLRMPEAGGGAAVCGEAGGGGLEAERRTAGWDLWRSKERVGEREPEAEGWRRNAGRRERERGEAGRGGEGGDGCLCNV